MFYLRISSDERNVTETILVLLQIDEKRRQLSSWNYEKSSEILAVLELQGICKTDGKMRNGLSLIP